MQNSSESYFDYYVRDTTGQPERFEIEDEDQLISEIRDAVAPGTKSIWVLDPSDNQTQLAQIVPVENIHNTVKGLGIAGFTLLFA